MTTEVQSYRNIKAHDYRVIRTMRNMATEL